MAVESCSSPIDLTNQFPMAMNRSNGKQNMRLNLNENRTDDDYGGGGGNENGNSQISP